MTATSTTLGRTRPGLGRRVLGWFRRNRWHPPEVPPVNVVGGFTFTTPARDDAFSFSVTVRCCWCASGGYDSAALERLIAERRPLDERVIRRVVRGAARAYEPYDAKRAEDDANQALEDEVTRSLGAVSRDDMAATCSAWIELDLAEPVRTFQQREWRARLGLEAHRSTSKRTIQTLSELRDRWLVFLGADPAALTNDWRVPFAIRLAEQGQQVTETVASMHWRRRRDVTFAVSFYNDVIKQYRNAGQYEFAKQVEDTLNKMIQAYNLPRYDLVGEMLQRELLPYTESDPMAHVFGLRNDQHPDASDPQPEMFGTNSGDGRTSGDRPADFWYEGEELAEEPDDQDAEQHDGPQQGESEEAPGSPPEQDDADDGPHTSPLPPHPTGHPGNGHVPSPRPDDESS
ncbi:hypothetical protein [Nonomuraea insulae]|uniref:Uncharacterized protein n=1 Tax=Nonomuraea insulae TaxID=1616787 RepID=A0ABW1CRV8_9ACTN